MSITDYIEFEKKNVCLSHTNFMSFGQFHVRNFAKKIPDLKNNNNLKNEDDFKYEYYLKNEDDLKNDVDLKIKTTSKISTT